MHFAGESLKALGHIFIVHIPYRGAAPAVADLRRQLPGESTIYLGDAASNTFSGGAGDDMIDGGAGMISLDKFREALALEAPAAAPTGDPSSASAA